MNNKFDKMSFMSSIINSNKGYIYPYRLNNGLGRLNMSLKLNSSRGFNKGLLFYQRGIINYGGCGSCGGK